MYYGVRTTERPVGRLWLLLKALLVHPPLMLNECEHLLHVYIRDIVFCSAAARLLHLKISHFAFLCTRFLSLFVPLHSARIHLFTNAIEYHSEGKTQISIGEKGSQRGVPGVSLFAFFAPTTVQFNANKPRNEIQKSSTCHCKAVNTLNVFLHFAQCSKVINWIATSASMLKLDKSITYFTANIFMFVANKRPKMLSADQIFY